LVDLSRFRGTGERPPTSEAGPVDPEAIFRRAPKGASSFPDLWRGQTDALRQWHTRLRAEADVLIALNTGGGKTVVGTLIAQSLINEGLEHVVYACGTIDLVRQTARESSRLGLSPTLRIQQKFSDDRFESGKSFCITTYASLYQPFSRFRTALRPSAIIFDDAHTSEGYLRDAFTISVDRAKNGDVFTELCRVVTPAFRQINRAETFNDTVNDPASRTVLLVPPFAVAENADVFAGILRRLRSDRNHDFQYRWGALSDHIRHCAVTISHNTVEFTPPFLPITTLPYFSGDNYIRRVYLSATINYKSDLIRCCGREIPDPNIIAPRNDAGEGERLVMFSRYLDDGDALEKAIPSIARDRKVVVSVPSYPAARRWSAVGVPPKPEEFSAALEQFRQRPAGGFILVYRLDGIDLPDEVCRIMVMDGLPTGATQLERYQWQSLHMTNALAAKLASRITQLFGRINRGTRDYSVHIVVGRALNTWLSNDRNLALLSPLMRSQIQLGHALHEQLEIKNTDGILSLSNAVLNRDDQWLNIYRTEIQDKDLDPVERDRSEIIEEKMVAAALAEIKFAEYCWLGQLDQARLALEEVAANVARGDGRMAGWFNLWIGYCYEVAGDAASAQQAYQLARQKLGSNVPLPLGRIVGTGFDLNTMFQKKMESLLLTTPEAFARQERLFSEGVLSPFTSGSGTAFALEEALRQLGEFMGYDASRPDNEGLGGPDVLWLDTSSNGLIGFELKTDKKAESAYNIEEVGKGHSYLEWLRTNHQERCLGLIFIGPRSPATQRATPSDDMYVAEISEIVTLANAFRGFLSEARGFALGARVAFIKRKENEEFGLLRIFERLGTTRMRSLSR
jgi:hypothetical protein